MSIKWQIFDGAAFYTFFPWLMGPHTVGSPHASLDTPSHFPWLVFLYTLCWGGQNNLRPPLFSILTLY